MINIYVQGTQFYLEDGDRELKSDKDEVLISKRHKSDTKYDVFFENNIQRPTQIKWDDFRLKDVATSGLTAWASELDFRLWIDTNTGLSSLAGTDEDPIKIQSVNTNINITEATVNGVLTPTANTIGYSLVFSGTGGTVNGVNWDNMPPFQTPPNFTGTITYTVPTSTNGRVVIVETIKA